MATGDITACRILATGWEAEIDIEGLAVGGTYAMDGSGATLTNPATAKVVFTVVSEGYTISGTTATLGTKTRTVYGTRARQKAYPNHAAAQEAVADNTLTVTVALSEYIYDDDNTGAGKSGTAPTVTIGSGFYTQGGTPNNATTDLAVTNNSTQDYPKVIGRWAVVPYQRFTLTATLEMVAFHRFAEYGKPVAGVIFTAKEGATTKETLAATDMVKSGAADSLPCYRAYLTGAEYTDHVVVTCDFVAYPWVGDADSVLNSSGTANALTLGSLPLFSDPDDDYPVYKACVNTGTGNDTSGVASTTYATAAAAPCATINGAMNKIAAATGGGVDAGLILLQSNDHSWGDGTDTLQSTTNVWLTVTRDYLGGTTKANACIIGAPNADVKTNLMRLYDLTLKPTGYIGYGNATGRTLWQDHVDIVCASQVSTKPWRLFDIAYHTFCTSDKLDFPCSEDSTNTIPALVRGCTASLARGFGEGNGYGASCTLTSTITSSSPNGEGPLVGLSRANSIGAYNIRLRGGTSQNQLVDIYASDTALVCNCCEAITGISTVSDSCGGGTLDPANNKILWHNTIAGQRTLVGYCDTGNYVRSNFSVKFNSCEFMATKHDVFATNGTYIKGWSVLYGVGWMGNNSEENPDNFYPNWGGINGTRTTAAGYTDDQSLTTSGSGGGTYTTTVGSVLRGKIPSAASVVIPWDLAGVAYAAGGDAGAYTHATGGGHRFWTYS